MRKSRRPWPSWARSSASPASGCVSFSATRSIVLEVVSCRNGAVEICPPAKDRRPKKEQPAMKAPSRTTSGPRHIVCPVCGSGELQQRGPELGAGCDSCGLSVGGEIFRTLGQIAALPDAVGSHACEECDHPEIRRLPDGVFHCPACGSEVLPIEIPSTPSTSIGQGEAYWAGWVAGRFGN